MVQLDAHKEVLIMDEDETNKNALREERQRTGRYIAIGTAIFLSLLGAYQAVARGTPQYAALFAPALIMFVYILWILYASKNQRKAALAKQEAESVVACDIEMPKLPAGPSAMCEDKAEVHTVVKETPLYSRSYSIA